MSSEPALLTERQAAELTNLSLAWFRRKRWHGGGPDYIKIGSAVRYERETLLNWFRQYVRRGAWLPDSAKEETCKS